MAAGGGDSDHPLPPPRSSSKPLFRPATVSTVADRLFFVGCGCALTLIVLVTAYFPRTPVPALITSVSAADVCQFPASTQSQAPAISVQPVVVEDPVASWSTEEAAPQAPAVAVAVAVPDKVSDESVVLISKKLSEDPVVDNHRARTFYDDPDTSYTIGNPIENWDEKRRQYVEAHPSVAGMRAASGGERVLMISGSQPEPCDNRGGDHLLLRFMKNKQDYSRIHGFDFFYNTALLDPAMPGYWAKIPVIRAMMVAHPEAEWVWWVDADAVITDMEFRPPFQQYDSAGHNLVVPGWDHMVYEEKNWLGLNAGVFLIRNCRWSLEFLESWARMGPASSEYREWGERLNSFVAGKMTTVADDQSALLYLIVTERWRYGGKVHLEGSYQLHGYWKNIVGRLGDIATQDAKMERRRKELRRRHAEKDAARYGEVRRENILRAAKWSPRAVQRRARPFVTHFTGCIPCSGRPNPAYGPGECSRGMDAALTFADAQVLRLLGFGRPEWNSSSAALRPLPFDFPRKGF